MSVNWGDEPLREEAVDAANAAMGIMAELTSSVITSIQNHRNASANQALLEEICQSVMAFGERCDNRVDELRATIDEMTDYLDDVSAENTRLEQELAQSQAMLRMVRDELETSKANLQTEKADSLSYIKERDKAERENKGLSRYKQDVNQRLAIHEQRFAEVMGLLNAYQDVCQREFPEHAAEIARKAQIAVKLPPAFTEAMAELQEKTYEHAQDCSSFLNTVAFENNWEKEEYWSHKQTVEDCFTYSKDFYADPARRDIETARRLIEAAKKLNADTEVTSKISELMPLFNRILIEAEHAWREEKDLRLNTLNELSDLCGKACSLIKTDFAQDTQLSDARIEATHAIEQLKEADTKAPSLSIPDLYANSTPQADAALSLTRSANVLREAFAGREPLLERQLDALSTKSTAILGRTSPQKLEQESDDTKSKQV